MRHLSRTFTEKYQSILISFSSPNVKKLHLGLFFFLRKNLVDLNKFRTFTLRKENYDMGMFFNNDKKTYCGTYKGISVWQYGCMIGNNWYGVFYCTRRKNGRNYKVRDSACRSLNGVKEYIDKHLEELKEITK